MSELSELLESNKKLEKQNEEILRLLRILIGETQQSDEEIHEAEEETPQEIEETPEAEISEEGILKSDPAVGEVYFIDGGDIYMASVRGGDFSIENLTGNGRPSGFGVQKLIATHSVKQNMPLDSSTVILGETIGGKLSNILEICADEGASKVFIPSSLIGELIDVPSELQRNLQLEFYRTFDDLVEKIF